MLKVQDIADMVDHSLLRPELTGAAVREGCRIVSDNRCISICAKPADVALCGTAPARKALVKVILEKACFSGEQEAPACRLSEEAGADFVKTSGGFAKSGATSEDLKPMRASCSAHVQIMAAGGVRMMNDALEVRKAAAATGHEVTRIVLGYLLAQPFPMVAIVACYTRRNLKVCLRAAGARLAPEVLTRLEAVIRGGNRHPPDGVARAQASPRAIVPPLRCRAPGAAEG